MDNPQQLPGQQTIRPEDKFAPVDPSLGAAPPSLLDDMAG